MALKRTKNIYSRSNLYWLDTSIIYPKYLMRNAAARAVGATTSLLLLFSTLILWSLVFRGNTLTKNILYKPNQHSDKKWLLLNDSLTNGQRRKWRCFRSNCLQTLRKRPHRKFQCQGLKRPQPLVFFYSYVMQKGFAICKTFKLSYVKGCNNIA